MLAAIAQFCDTNAEAMPARPERLDRHPVLPGSASRLTNLHLQGIDELTVVCQRRFTDRIKRPE
jgi:hypothetical protein